MLAIEKVNVTLCGVKFEVRTVYTGSLLDVIRTYYSLLTINVYILVYAVTYSTFMLYTTTE